jgi:enoyl-[acyl-carrier-protein] reductase (NADH)
MTTRVSEYKFTDDQIIDAIKGSCGIITNIANSLGCSWDTANNRIKNGNEIVKTAYRDETERVIDKAESVINKAIDKDDIQTAKWFLATKGKVRGYSEKTEVEHTGDMQILVNIQGVKAES